MRLRRSRADDAHALTCLWERSVRATHDFLSDEEIRALYPLVADELASDAIDWWVVEGASHVLMGFLGYTHGTVEALFVDPSHHGRGVGRALVEHAQSMSRGALQVDVNEQNAAARRFYEHLGFAVVARSPVDSAGRPFPILHMQRAHGRTTRTLDQGPRTGAA